MVDSENAAIKFSVLNAAGCADDAIVRRRVNRYGEIYTCSTALAREMRTRSKSGRIAAIVREAMV